LSRSNQLLVNASAVIILVFIITGCVSTTPYDIVDRRVANNVDIDDIYKHEHKYIKQRRRAAGFGSLDKAVIGMAFSGGGIRSATFNLGVLQALEKRGCLRYIDYLSTVSGGAYIGTWYVSHLLTDGDSDKYSPHGVLVASSNPKKLLLNTSYSDDSAWQSADSIEHFRNSSSFLINPKWGIPGLAFKWSALYVPNLIFDVGLHFKPTRGKWNWHHPFYMYRDRIEDTYLPGWDGKEGNQFLLEEINSPDNKAPYLIINATLGNRNRSRNKRSGTNENWIYFVSPFEFTRDFCGSPVTGYIETTGFDKPVYDVEFSDGFPSKAFISAEKPLKLIPDTKQFPLANAVTASGAAMDSGNYTGWKRFAMDALLKGANANVRYETRNFSQTCASWYAWPYDRLVREFVFDRFGPTAKSNTLLISDGGHYDNLGVVALVRRRTEKILVLDASADPNYDYASLKQSKKALGIERCSIVCNGFIWKFDDGFPAKDNKPVSYVMKGTISCECEGDNTEKYKADVYYCKSTNLNDSDLPKYVASYDNESDSFPHKTTAKQWYDWKRFEAYRQLGYYIGERLMEKAQGVFVQRQSEQ
jgi:hypothetical protein